MEKSKNTVIQISALFLIQWLSIVVIILNASALNSSKDSNQGLILASETGPQDYILLIMAASSLFAVSLLLCLYLQLFLRLIGNNPISSPSKKVLYVEIAFCLIIVASWMAASIIVLHFFNSSSSCRNPPNISTLTDKVSFDNTNRLSTTACNLVDATIIVAFVTIGIWIIALFTSLYSLIVINKSNINSPIHPYENVKLQINRYSSASSIMKQRDPVQYNNDNSGSSLHYSSSTIITKIDPHHGNVLVVPVIPQQQKKEKEEQQNDNNKEISSTATPIITTSIINNNNNDIQRSPNHMQKKSITTTTNNNNQPQEPKPVILTKNNNTLHDWKFDFEFEPVQIDLMLPSASELVRDSNNSKKKYHY